MAHLQLPKEISAEKLIKINTLMSPETFKLFAQFCESYLPEASSAMALIQQHPGGKEVVKKLHQTEQLGHDISYSAIPKISWSDLKDNWRGAWVIIQGDKGTGAIKATGGNTGTYLAVASTGGEPRSVKDSRGGNVIDFLKGEIGGLRKFYVGKNTTAVTDKKKKRAANAAGAGPTIVNNETLVKKFKPLWAKAITAAIADIKGHVANMIKNDAFEKAKRKLNHIETLQSGLESIEAGSLEGTPDFVGRAVQTAVLMAAAHYYPETTGDINRDYGSRYTTTHEEGPRQLLKDISEGDTAKLGTILTFFKRALISG
jgi:hypothetical protein